MSNSAGSIGSVSAQNLASRFAVPHNTLRSSGRGGDGGDGDGNGLTVLSALLQALVSAADHSSSSTAATSSAGPATTSSVSAASASSASSSSASSPGSSLTQDLGAFLHDLSAALRQAGRQAFEGRHLREQSQPGASNEASAATASTPAPAVATTSTPGATSATTAPAPTNPAAPVSAAAPTANPAAGAYGPQGIINALQQLIKDISNSQVVSGSSLGSTSAGASSQVISNLNSAFQKLITDLGGASSPSGSPSDTGALQSFLNGFLQDLQNGNGSGNTGNVINTSA